MIRTIDPKQLGIPTLVLPPRIGGTSSRPSEAPACRRCVEFSPGPRLDGTLLVDPEIHLPSPGMDVDIAYFYNGNSTYNGPYGYGRTISPNLLAVASGVNAIVTLQRGDGSLVSFQDDGSGTFVAKTPGLLNSLVKDTTNSYWKESTLDGQTLAYPLNTSGMVTSIAYQEDAVGNRHSFLYSAGKLETLQDAVDLKGMSCTASYMTVDLKADGRTISEAWFETYSCPVAMACGSWLTAWVQGRTHEQAMLLEPSDLEKLIGGVPLGKEYCAEMAVSSLRDASVQYVGAKEA